MKLTLRRTPAFSTIDVLLEVLQRPGPMGVSVEEMRDRLRLVGRIEQASGGEVLELDNSDYQKIVQMLEGFRFGVVTRDLLDIVDGIMLDAPVTSSLTAHQRSLQ